ncbi:MAG: FAD-binding oxidoreductase [Rhizobiaceae bacterium]|nr:FAD-binding oxidoreductase [Rhizobiaceae bacterium]
MDFAVTKDLLAKDLLARLTGIVGESGVMADADPASRYRRDWSGDGSGLPLAVVRPRSSGEVARVAALCSERGVKLVPQGGHTGLVSGALPSAAGDELVLSLERLNRIVSIDEDNFSMVVEAGCVLETVRAAAAERGFVFPLALGSQGSCQIGGAVATNAGGLNVLRYGMMRDLVLGLEMVLPDGRVWDGQKALRKDNTGYDLKQLVLGSEGTLGIVTAVTLKLFPAPTQVETAFLALDSADAVVKLYGQARRDLCDLLSAFELLTDGGVVHSGLPNPLGSPAPCYVLLEISASGLVDARALLETFLESALERGLVRDGAMAATSAHAASFWQIREMIIERQRREGRHLRTDISVPISAIARFIAQAESAIEALSPDAIVLAYGHIGDGNLHFNVVPPAGLSEAGKIDLLHRCEERIFAVLDGLGGSISAEHGIGRLKRHAFLDRISPVHRDLLGAIKQVFDPAGILNPGRILEHRAP